MPKLTQQQLLAHDLSETELQRYVVELAELLGWTVRHARDSRRQNLTDLPDLLLIRPPRIVWMELKAQRGKVTPDQAVMIEMLLDCHAEVYVIRPSNWLVGTVERILRSLERPQGLDLSTRMAGDKGFAQATERGLAEIEQGRYSRIEDVKKKLGDV